ncbi:MAG: hypothetical protein E6Q97_17745 [Desulfurellales bacterium]|nr:MAG: hypothetical protein E6Q97_17745 [Desulfurellales bacterium]
MSDMDIALRKASSSPRCENCKSYVGVGSSGQCTTHNAVTLDFSLCSSWERAPNPTLQVRRVEENK